MPKKKAKVASAADSSPPAGGSPCGEVPVVDEEALRRLFGEDELREAALRSTAEKGTNRYSYEAGDTVHGRVDTTRLKSKSSRRSFTKHDTIRGTSFSTDTRKKRRVQLGVLALPSTEWIWRPFLPKRFRIGENAGQHGGGAELEGQSLYQRLQVPVRPTRAKVPLLPCSLNVSVKPSTESTLF